jgi:hypothetical protein
MDKASSHSTPPSRRTILRATAAKAALEPIGHLTFGLAEGRPIIPESTIEDWYFHARLEFLVSRAILPILNSSDKEIEETITSAADQAAELDKLMTLAETCKQISDRYKAGMEVMDSAMCRALVVVERLMGGVS